MDDNRHWPVEDNARVELTRVKQKVSSQLLEYDDGGAARGRAVQDVVQFKFMNLAEKYNTFDIAAVLSHRNLVRL